MTPPPERPRFYNFRVKVRRAALKVVNELGLGAGMARRSWYWLVRGPSRVLSHTVLRRLVLGLPAVVAAGAAATVLVLNPKADQIQLRSRYRAEAEHALATGRFDEARVRYQRMSADAGYPASDVYGWARALEGEGRRTDAELLYRRLAPENRTGYPDAHLRRAVQLMGQSPPDFVQAERHLRRAIHARPDYPEAYNLIGQIKMKEGDATGAAENLLHAVKALPELSLPLAIVYLGRDANASTHWATEAAAYFDSAAKAHPDDATAGYRFALALRLAHRYQESADAIRAGLARANDRQLRLLAAEVYSEWCATLTGGAQAAERLRRIEEGLELNAAAGPLLQGLVATAGGTGPVADLARAQISQRIAAGGPAAVGLRLASGLDAQKRGKIAEARQFLGDAHRDDPASLIVANNLAWVLIQDPNPEPDRALAIVEEALKGRTDEPTLRDTRGQILVRLGRWPEAARDLEFALPRIAPNRDTHRALASAYRGMNLAALANGQDREAEQLSK